MGVIRMGGLRAALAAAAVCLLAAACGSSASSSGGGGGGNPFGPGGGGGGGGGVTTLDACGLVTAAEASTAANTPLTKVSGGGSGSSGAAGTSSICIYNSADHGVTVSVVGVAYPPSVPIQSVIQSAIQSKNSTKVDGIGDVCYIYRSSSSTTGNILFTKGQDLVAISVSLSSSGTSSGTGPSDDTLKALASTAVGRL